MLAIVTNFGRPRVFPSCQGNFWLNRLEPIEVRDPELIKQLLAYNKRRDILLKIEIISEPEGKRRAKIKEDNIIKEKAEKPTTQKKEPTKKVEKKEIKTDYPDKAEFKMNYSKFKIQQLRSMAVAKGIEGTFKMTKKLLIKNLEEKNGIS